MGGLLGVVLLLGDMDGGESTFQVVRTTSAAVPVLGISA
jgi:hypothetical protein